MYLFSLYKMQVSMGLGWAFNIYKCKQESEGFFLLQVLQWFTFFFFEHNGLQLYINLEKNFLFSF